MTAPIIDPAAQLVEHGHYHKPVLDHQHSDSSGVTDLSHILLHVMGDMDNQIVILSRVPLAQQPLVLPYLAEITLAPEPPFTGLYRPPRT